jgi:hypothetical protein
MLGLRRTLVLIIVALLVSRKNSCVILADFGYTCVILADFGYTCVILADFGYTCVISADFGYPVYALWFYLLPEISFGFPLFSLGAYLMKVIPETCLVH